MTEVEYGGGGHHTRLGDINRSTCVYRGAPLPPYIKEQGGEAAGQGGRAKGESAPTGSRTPTLPRVGVGEREGGERGKERGAPPPSLSNSD